MSEEAQFTPQDDSPNVDYLGAFITIHVDGLDEVRHKEGRIPLFWDFTPFAVYLKWLESLFTTKRIYDSTSECFGCKREYYEDTYLVENRIAYAILNREAGIHHWKVKSLATNRTYEFEGLIEVVPLIPTDDFNWHKNTDIEMEAFYTYAPGGASVVKTLSGICLKHLPTGITARATETRAALENRIYAAKLLFSRLFAHEQGTLHNYQFVRTVDIANSFIRNERTGYVSSDITSFLAGNITPDM